MGLTLELLDDHYEATMAALGSQEADIALVRDEIVVTAKPENLLAVLRALRDSSATACKQVVDITAVDFLNRQPRFDLVYHLLSHANNLRVRVKVPCSDEAPVASACAVYSSALWYEREVWDMYGIFFADHPDLRRILTDYGFEGHPLRKDFPLTGYTEVRYDDEQKRIVYEPVNLPQEFRSFDFSSPWEGVLPGDEKASSEKSGDPQAAQKEAS